MGRRRFPQVLADDEGGLRRETHRTAVGGARGSDRPVVGRRGWRGSARGAFVRWLAMRDVGSLCEEAGLGSVSKASAARMCKELRAGFAAFQRRDLYEVRLVALFLDATFLAVRPSGPKEGVLVAWGFTDAGARVLLSVMLDMRASY